MLSNERLRRHAALVDDMVGALGLDLEEQVMRGKLSIPDIDDAVLRCTGCACADTCESWLATRSDVSPTTPSYCRNTGLFSDLKAL